MTDTLRIGVDLGGTKIEAVVLDDARNERFRRRVPTPQGDYAATLAAIAALIDDAERTCGAAASVGVGSPGAQKDDGMIKNANSTVLNGKPLRKDLETLLQRKILLENDANCFILSEAIDGAAIGATVAFGVILGTGVGGGIAVGARPLRGCNAIAGEWGHNPLPWPSADEYPGPACYCGKHGCIETLLNGGAFAKLRSLHRERAIDVYADRLGRALAHVVNVLDPDVVVFGGGVSNVDALYDVLPEIVARYAFSDVLRTRFVKARHGDASGVRGAASLGT